MPRNIVVCCDGTANEFARANTNVVKLYSMLDHDTPDQCAYYHPGLGTMEPPGVLTTPGRILVKLAGRAFGYGLRDDVRDAYVFIMRNWQPNDRLFLFGFSRGAYTVRVVASLLHMYGLLRPGNETNVPYAIRMMMAINKLDKRENPGSDPRRSEYFALAGSFKKNMARECDPWFVGIWDTVSSMGWIDNPLHVPFVASNPSVHISRHAVAIDERRAFFRTHLWLPSKDASKSGPKDLKQVWFPGVHCDVGGGYPEPESGLSKIALTWMVEEAKQNGLRVNATAQARILGLDGSHYARADPASKAHESLTGLWHAAEIVPKRHFDYANQKWRYRMNLWRRRTIPPGSLVHESAFQRGAATTHRLPSDVVRVS